MSQEISYHGKQHHFIFSEQNGHLSANVKEKSSQTLIPFKEIIVPQPCSSNSLPPLRQVTTALKLGYYPVISNGILSFYPKQALKLAHTDAVRGLLWLADGTLVSRSLSTTNMWDPISGDRKGSLQGNFHIMTTLVVSSDGRLLSGSSDGMLRVWESVTGQPFIHVQGPSKNIDLLTEIEPNNFVSAMPDYGIGIWDLADSSCTSIQEKHTGPITALVRLTPTRFASASQDGTIKIWDLPSKSCIRTLKGHSGVIQTMIKLRDGRLASGSADGTIKVWHPDQDTPLHSFTGHTDKVLSILETEDGALVSGAGANDESIKVWHLTQNKCLRTFAVNQASVFTLLDLGAGMIAGGTSSGYIVICNTAIDTPVELFKGHDLAVHALTKQGDDTIISASQDTTIKFWHCKAPVSVTPPAPVTPPSSPATPSALPHASSTSASTATQTPPGITVEEATKLIGDSIRSGLKKQRENFEVDSIVNTLEFERKMKRLEGAIEDSLKLRDRHIKSDLSDVRKLISQVTADQAPLLADYRAKQAELLEQEELQKNPAVYAYYHTCEKYFSSKLMSAMLQVGGLLQRHETNAEHALRVAGEIATNSLGMIPDTFLIGGGIFSGIAGLTALAAEEALAFSIDSSQDKRNQTVFDAAGNLKDTPKFAELAARRAAQQYNDRIISYNISVEQAQALGKRAGKVMFKCMNSEAMKKAIDYSIERKVQLLIDAVEDDADESASVSSNNNNSPQQPSKTSHWAYKGLLRLFSRSSRPNKPIKSICDPDKQALALSRLKKGITFNGEKFTISPDGKNKKVVVKCIKSSNVGDSLRLVHERVMLVFADTILDGLNIQLPTKELVINTKGSMDVLYLEKVLKDWLPA